MSVLPQAMPASPAPDAAARRARLAVVAAFFGCGFTTAGWVVHIPLIMRATGIDDAALGFLLLVMGGSALVAMQLGGYLAARSGSKGLVLGSALVMAVGLCLTGPMASAWSLAAALVILGLGTGGLDMAMNEQAVRVEKAYGRPIMGSFHAFYSIAGAFGAAAGAALLAFSLPLPLSVGIMAAVGLATTMALWAWLLPGRSVAVPVDHEAIALTAERTGAPVASSSPAGQDPDSGGPPRAKSASVARLATLLAVMAFASFVAEGTVNDWSARHAVEHLAQSPAAAAFAFGTFSVTMTLARFAADKVAGRLGGEALVRYGTLLAALGMLVVVLSPAYPLVLLGWALYGLGLAGVVPQIFTAAGSLVEGPRSAVVLARVVGFGYVGLLAGPALVGWLSGAVGLNNALLLPVGLCLLAAALSPVLRRR